MLGCDLPGRREPPSHQLLRLRDCHLAEPPSFVAACRAVIQAETFRGVRQLKEEIALPQVSRHTNSPRLFWIDEEAVCERNEHVVEVAHDHERWCRQRSLG